MEVETHSIPGFDLNSAARPFCTQPGSSGSMENDVVLSPIKGDNSKCDDESFCEWNSTESAAKKVQKYYRSYRTRRLLADTAVAAEEFWWQAIDFARLNHSTISFFNFSKPETAASRWNRVSLNASKVGQGLSVDAKAQKLALQHWIEAIDPRHRYGHSLHLYYEEWCKADAGQPFFYWLDVGDGKEVDLPKCPRSKLRQQCIKYLGTVRYSVYLIVFKSVVNVIELSSIFLDIITNCSSNSSSRNNHQQEREHYEYVVVEGKIVHRQTGNFLDTNKGLPGAKWIFVMSTHNKLVI